MGLKHVLDEFIKYKEHSLDLGGGRVVRVVFREGVIFRVTLTSEEFFFGTELRFNKEKYHWESICGEVILSDYVIESVIKNGD